MSAVPQRVNKSQVRQHFSLHAREYDRYARVQAKVAARLAEQLPDCVRGGALGLEVGCGTGMLSRRVLQRFPDLSLILTDLAHGMSQYSQEQFPASPVCDADAANLPFIEQSLDLVVTSSVYQWLNDLPNAFGEVARVLKPGGLFAIALFGEKTLFELRDAHQSALGSRPSHGQNFPTLELVRTSLGDRFDLQLLSSENEIEWHPTVQDLFRSLKKIGAQNASESRPQGLASRRVIGRMIDVYQQQFGGQNGIPATYEVIYMLASRKDVTD